MDNRLGGHVDVAFAARAHIELRKEWIESRYAFESIPGTEKNPVLMDHAVANVQKWEDEIAYLREVALNNGTEVSQSMNAAHRNTVMQTVQHILDAPVNALPFDNRLDLTKLSHSTEIGRDLNKMLIERQGRDRGDPPPPDLGDANPGGGNNPPPPPLPDGGAAAPPPPPPEDKHPGEPRASRFMEGFRGQQETGKDQSHPEQEKERPGVAYSRFLQRDVPTDPPDKAGAGEKEQQDMATGAGESRASRFMQSFHGAKHATPDQDKTPAADKAPPKPPPDKDDR